MLKLIDMKFDNYTSTEINYVTRNLVNIDLREDVVSVTDPVRNPAEILSTQAFMEAYHQNEAEVNTNKSTKEIKKDVEFLMTEYWGNLAPVPQSRSDSRDFPPVSPIKKAITSAEILMDLDRKTEELRAKGKDKLSQQGVYGYFMNLFYNR